MHYPRPHYPQNTGDCQSTPIFKPTKCMEFILQLQFIDGDKRVQRISFSRSCFTHLFIKADNDQDQWTKLTPGIHKQTPRNLRSMHRLLYNDASPVRHTVLMG
ncbi:hypothetical protein ASPCADRAFT_409633 [Aspergillus carbonarius ITEM 5010]|uniref:Uncharacterized protein n=1 Tax=Aspergillus carbonarius (strain ITEM 5010) TaxID=602072 RepID=A0A1R3R8W3_ASPC5|nr:hypothetical protein ASPCADRAFT_409633 [Aspergillus carbonarius ITEM 5010]